MRSIRLGTVLFAGLLTLGCGGPDCPEGTVASEGRCVAASRDAAGLDAGPLPDGADTTSDASLADCRTTGCAEPSTPVCDTTTGACVACLSGADCGAGTPFCTDGHLCVACRDASDCSADRPACDGGSCRGCLETDCSPDEFARWFIELNCQHGAEHEEGSDIGDSFEALFCGGRFESVSIFGRMVGVLRRGEVTVDRDRASGCSERDVASALLGDSPCAVAWRGTLADGASCPFSETCVSGYCAMSSACSGVCAPRVAAGGACADPDACAEGLVCAGGHCEAPRAEGASCAGDGVVCAEGLYCDTSRVCRPRRGEGEACSYAIPCTVGLECVASVCRGLPTEGEACRPDYSSPRCADGLRCAADVCRRPKALGAGCASSSECPFGARCQAGFCRAVLHTGDLCDASLPCPHGQGCIGSSCRPLPDVGDACDAAIGCLRGRCASGRCENLEAGATCAPSRFVFDFFDPCGSLSSCAEISPGTWQCRLEGGPGSSCGGSNPPCRAPDLDCDYDTLTCTVGCGG